MARNTDDGLTPSQLSALSTVDQVGPVRVTDVAVREGVAPPSMTRIVASLEALDLLDRRPDPADGRAAVLVASAAGVALLQRIRRERTAYLAQRIAALDEPDLAALQAAVPVSRRWCRTCRRAERRQPVRRAVRRPIDGRRLLGGGGEQLGLDPVADRGPRVVGYSVARTDSSLRTLAPWPASTSARSASMKASPPVATCWLRPPELM